MPRTFRFFGQEHTTIQWRVHQVAEDALADIDHGGKEVCTGIVVRGGGNEWIQYSCDRVDALLIHEMQYIKVQWFHLV